MMTPSTIANADNSGPLVPLPNAIGMGPIKMNPPVETLPPIEEIEIMTSPNRTKAKPTRRNQGFIGHIT